MGQGSEIYETYCNLAEQGIWRESEEIGRVVSVSFAAAALLLFVDLEMERVEEAAPYRLAEQIGSLAHTVNKLIEGLEGAAEELDTISANRAAGRQPSFKGRDYRTLRNYRMGSSLDELAEAHGIQPYSSRTVKGTRDWKAKVKKKITKGKAVEDEEYPRAASIFANHDDTCIRDKACQAYRFYVKNGCRCEADVDWDALAQEIRVGSIYKRRDHEIASAYLQLGSCIELDIPLQP